MTKPIWLVGAGNMGGAILRGWLGNEIDPSRITVIDPGKGALPEGVAHYDRLPDQGEPDIIVLAVKPQQLDALDLTGKAPARLLISVLAGVETATLQRVSGATAIVRAMPNLPAAIGEGVTALFSASADSAAREEASRLMAPLGKVEWIDDEKLFDAVTALSGSGPGFVFRFIEAMAQAGADLGLSPDLASRLAIATVRGSALLAGQSDVGPAVLADRVASPGGTTREGLNVLDQDGAMRALMAKTLAAAARRSGELAVALRR